MKILLLLTDLFGSGGGIAAFNRTFVKALDEIASEQGWTASLLVLHDSSWSPARAGYFSPARMTYQGFSGRRARFSWHAVRESSQADLIIFGHAHLLSLALAMGANSKILLTHGIEVWKPLPALRRAGIQRMDQVFSVSRFTRDRMIQANKVRPERCHIFPNSLDPFFTGVTEFFSREQLGLPPGRMVLSVTRLSYADRYKKIDQFIAAWPAVLKEAPDAFLVIVGTGDDAGRLQQAARDTGVSEKVIFVGAVPDTKLPSYYRACDVFALPSLEEGFGIVFLEAMHHAKPCLGARAGGTPEVILDGETGLLSDPDHVKSIEKKLLQILRDPILRKKMGNAGYERIQKEFSFTAFRARLGALLRPELSPVLSANSMAGGISA